MWLMSVKAMVFGTPIYIFPRQKNVLIISLELLLGKQIFLKKKISYDAGEYRKISKINYLAYYRQLSIKQYASHGI